MVKASSEGPRNFRVPITMNVNCTAYIDLMRSLLRQEYPQRHGRKILARTLGISERSVGNWFDGACAPRGAELIRLMQANDRIASEIFHVVRGTNGDSGV